MPDVIRSFIAVDVPQEIKTDLSTVVDELKKSRADVKWTQAQNIHITVKFLGDTPQKSLPNIMELLKNLAAAFDSFSFSLTKIDAFPSLTNPRVIWVGISQPDPLAALAGAIEDGCEQLGFPREERVFHAHLTLGRVRSAKNIRELSNTIQTISIPQGRAVHINKITLYQSALASPGPVYTPLATFQLKNNLA